MPETVKCADCGFLAVRLRATREFVDAETETREEGHLSDDGANLPVYVHQLVCFVRAFDLPREVQPGLLVPQFKQIAQKDRPCKRLTPWHQGFSPKEHQEMLDRQLMIAADREWKAKENRFRQLELLAVIVLAPLMAWFIPWLVNKFAPSSPAPIPAATAPLAK